MGERCYVLLSKLVNHRVTPQIYLVTPLRGPDLHFKKHWIRGFAAFLCLYNCKFNISVVLVDPLVIQNGLFENITLDSENSDVLDIK